MHTTKFKNGRCQPGKWLNDSADGQNADAGVGNPYTGDRILRVGGGRNGNLAGYGGEQAGGGIIGVVCRLAPGDIIKGYGTTALSAAVASVLPEFCRMKV